MNTVEDLSLLIAAFVASLFGQGGGVLYTSFQVWNGIGITTAASTSLFLILINSFSSTLVFRKAHKVDWGLAFVLETPTTLGAFIGGVLSHYIPSQTLGLLLSVLLGSAGGLMLHRGAITMRNRKEKGCSPHRWIWQRTWAGENYQVDLSRMIPLMLAVGVLTSMVGIGGGALKVPLMILVFGIPAPIAIGSSAFMVGMTATAGLLGHISVGHFNWSAALMLAIPVFIGGQIGSRLSVKLGAQRLSRWFGVFVLMIAIFSGFHAWKFL